MFNVTVKKRKMPAPCDGIIYHAVTDTKAEAYGATPREALANLIMMNTSEFGITLNIDLKDDNDELVPSSSAQVS